MLRFFVDFLKKFSVLRKNWANNSKKTRNFMIFQRKNHKNYRVF